MMPVICELIALILWKKVYLLFLQVLPEEYNIFRQTIDGEKESFTIDGLLDEISERYDLLRKGKSRSSDTPLSLPRVETKENRVS